MDRLSQYKCCVIIPTYNNSGSLEKVMTDILAFTEDLIVVNDGSTDGTTEILNKYNYLHIISYPKNMGKGNALKMGFSKALELGYEYAITIDSDGQHQANELPVFLDALENNQGAIIIGTRNFKELENLPSKNNFANNFSNFWFYLQTGIKLKDTQSGYRLYPLKLFKKTRYFSRKYEFELEVLVRAAWSGIPIVSTPIQAIYPPKEERISHFRPFRDFSRISILNFFLTTLAIAFYRPRQIFRKFRKKKIKDIIRDEIMSGTSSRKIVASSIGFGVFMGIFPVWGYQLLIGFTVAHLLKMNKAIFFLAANISLPPFIPFILYLSFVTGSFVMGEGSWQVDFDLSLDAIKINIKQYLIGSVVLACVAGFFTGLLTFFIFPFIKKKKNE